MRYAPSISHSEEKIRGLKEGQRNDDDSIAKYKHRLEKVKKEKEALGAEKEELHRQLGDAYIKLEAEKIARQESVAKAEGLGHQRS